MKKLLVNSLATTALTLLILAAVALPFSARWIGVFTIFQAFFVNLLIHVGWIFVRKIESRFYYVELLCEVVYVLLVLVGCGFLFGWYSSTPLWVVVLMGIVIYVIGCVINTVRIGEDLSAINFALQNQKDNH